MNLKQAIYLIRADLHRYRGACKARHILRELLIGTSTKYTVWFRLVQYLDTKRPLSLPFFLFGRWMLKRCIVRFGIQMGHGTQVGPGLHIGHFGGIVVAGSARIGRNCNISQGVTIGIAHKNREKGAPVIGDNVYIGPNAVVIGAIKIGDNVAIGANAVVTKDLPDDAVAVGVPAKVISDHGSYDYVNRTDYD